MLQLLCRLQLLHGALGIVHIVCMHMQNIYYDTNNTQHHDIALLTNTHLQTQITTTYTMRLMRYFLFEKYAAVISQHAYM